MIIGDQLRALREQQNLSQGEIEKRTGLLRCYVSRVEKGHTIPSIETLEKWARVLNVSLYQVFYEGNDSQSPQPLKAENSDLGKDAHYLSLFPRMLRRTRERDRRYGTLSAGPTAITLSQFESSLRFRHSARCISRPAWAKFRRA